MLTLTARNLLQMTDRSAFERLALQVLRFAEPDCASVIRLGTNEQGETIVSPLDGFAFVPGRTPALQVAVESTTTDATGLERKWLYDHTTYVPGKKPPKSLPTEADDGDLRKAAREAQTLRQGNGSIRCKIYLATNQIVDPALRAKVDQVANALNVECEVWEQSRIADYLDIDPTGQYLRLKYFGTPAERLSGSLLLDVSRNALQQYAHEGRVSSIELTSTPRQLDAEVLRRADDAKLRLILLVGDSGFGKTVAAYRAMAAWLHRSAPALWLRANQIETADSLHAALDTVIRGRVPTIAEYSVRSLSEALGGDRLLIAVDDINRSQSPAVLLRRLLTWSSAAPEVAILCPVWPRFIDTFHLSDRKDVALIRVGSFTPVEAENVLGGPASQSLAAALHHDPFLIGIARMLAGSGVNITANFSARQVLAKFIDHELDMLQSGESGTRSAHHSSEHRNALERTSRGSLQHLQLNPTAGEARAWIADDRVWSAMVELLRASGIVWTTSDERLCYRHDRLRDHLLAEAMRDLLANGESSSALTDPYFADVVAEALVQLETPAHVVASLLDNAPLALALALGVVVPGSDAEARLAQALSKWFAEERLRHGKVRVRFSHSASSAKTVHAAGTFNNWRAADEAWSFTPPAPGKNEWVLVAWIRPGIYEYKLVIDGVQWVGSAHPNDAADGFGGFNAIANVPEKKVDARFALTTAEARMIVRALARIDSAAVLDVARELPERELDVLLAMLRNGDVSAGIRFCQTNFADPMMGYLDRESAIESVRRLHLEGFAREFEVLSRELRSDDERLGAIVLAGHIGHAGTIEQAGRLWREADSRTTLLPQALWAQLRSSVPDFVTIETMLDTFLELQDDDKGGTRISARGQVTELLRLSGLRVEQSVVAWLRAIAQRKPELEWVVWTLLRRVDLPDAVESIVRMAAKFSQEARENGTFWLGDSMLTEGWRNHQMSPASAQRLQQIWEDSSESKAIRSNAFRIWSAGALKHPQTLDTLRAVAETSPFYEDATHCRALLGDTSAEPAFAKMLPQLSLEAVAASRIWGPHIVAALDARLAQWGDSANDSYHVADLLTLAPVGDARDLLVKNWTRIRLVPRFVQAALAVGGDQLEQLATETIATWPPGEEHPLRYAVLHLETGFEDGLAVPIDQDRIARLLPYADKLGEIGLLRLGYLARKHGLVAWGREHIGPLLDEGHRAEVFPTQTDVKREFDELLRNERARHLRTTTFAQRMEERSDGYYDPLNVLDEWLAQNYTETALQIAAEVIIALGRRAGIDILARHSDLSKTGHQQRLADVDVQVRRASL